MSLSESIEPSSIPAPARDLAGRRPGHALMTHLLRQLDLRGAGDVVPPDLSSWQVGALGEVLVGQELARLPEGWLVLHAVPAGPTADIDHLVVGPSGVHILNTKRHPDKKVVVGSHVVWVNGSPNPYQRDLLRRAQKVRTLLRPLLGNVDVVRPLLVFVDAARVTTTGEQTVPSVPMAGLVEHLLEQEAVLAPGIVRAVHAKAAQPITWGCGAEVLDEPDPSSRFHRLRQQPLDTAALPSTFQAAPVAHRPLARSCVGVQPPVRRLRAAGIAGRVAVLAGIVFAAPVVVLVAIDWFLALLGALPGR